MDEISKMPSPSWSTWAPRKWIGLIISALVLGEAIWLLIASLTRDVILPLMAMLMGGDNSSPLYLGKQELNLPDLFTAILQLCVAGLFAIVLNAWIQKKPRPIKTKSLRLNPAIAQNAPAQARAAAAQTSAATGSQPRPTRASPPDAPVIPKVAGAPAVPKSPPAPAAHTQPQTPAPNAAPPPPPKSAPKQPKEVYYNIVGERTTPLDEETTEQ
jgi:large-conductance mechanosensitive channel